MTWLETISRWLFFFIQICVSACRQKYLNYAHSAVAFPVFFNSSSRNWSCAPFQVFFLRYTYKARRASPISTSISTTSTSTTLLDVPTLPYLTLHYSPSREVDTIQERKSGTVRRTNQYRQRHIPTYLPRDIHVPIWATKNAYLGRYRYLYTYLTYVP